MSNPLDMPSEMIVASAGAGKTFELTNRFVALLGRQILADEELTPERFVAVTFTRKAAEEFFGSILTKVAEAAASDEAAAQLAVNAHDDTVHPILSQLLPHHYRKMLRSLVSHMAELPLCTLDAFFVSIVRVFATEFGLPRDFEILDEHEAARAAKRVLAEVCARPRNKVEQERMGHLVAAFRATRPDREDDRVARNLETFISDQHEILLDVPDLDFWSSKERIWGAAVPSTIGPDGPTVEDLETLDRLMPSLSDTSQGLYDDFRAEAERRRAGRLQHREKMFFGYATNYGWDKLRDPEIAEFRIKISRQTVLMSAKCGQVFHLVLSKIVGQEIHARLQRTKAVGEMLEAYEEAFEKRVRRQGGLGFKDVELLVGNRDEEGEPIFKRDEIDYRLDATHDQWLFDEFQDTSHAQWAAVSDLVGEAVQDPEAQRGLFLVGDPKQAIYSWRGGDSRIFDYVAKWYRHAPLNQRNLDVSWRSGPDVLELVNKVFRSDFALQQLNLPGGAVERWECAEHRPARPNVERRGYAAVLEAENKGDFFRFEILKAILKEMDPVANRISCAILVETNKVANQIVDWLRREAPEIPVVSESDAGIATDNALGLALLSLFELAAHPGDQFCLGHVIMSPLGEEALRLGLDPSDGTLSQHVRKQIAADGFERTIRDWSHAFLASSSVGEFTIRRAEDLAGVGRVFDESGSRDLDEFVAYARNAKTRDSSSRTAVQVMTIHKSKGQTFDAVLLPSLETRSQSQLSRVRSGIGISRNRETFQPEWVLDLPGAEISQKDPVLAEAYEEREVEAAVEALCKLYVGFTRPRYATYVILDPIQNETDARSFPNLLRRCLPSPGGASRYFNGNCVSVLWESELPTADPFWWTEIPAVEEPETAEEEATADPVGFSAAARVRAVSRTPSGAERHVVSARALLRPGRKRSLDHGLLVHRLLEEIEWLDDSGAGEFDAEWQEILADFDPDSADRALAEVKAALDDDAVRAALVRPGQEEVEGTMEVWNERRFEILLEGEWLSGAFDRVVVHRGKDGQALRAGIIDFKTDRTASDAEIEKKVEGYRPQLDLYRRVLARVLDIDPSRIDAHLLFTGSASLVQVFGN